MKRLEMFVLAVVLVFCIGFGTALAQQFQGQNLVTLYSAKFVCGDSGLDEETGGKVLSRADYRTAINIHNQTNEAVVIRKLVVFTELITESGPRVSGQSPQVPVESSEARDLLRPFGAVEWDCPQLSTWSDINSSNAFAKGFLIITADTVQSRSAPSLAVVGVYTSQGKTLNGFTECLTNDVCDGWSSGNVTLHLEQYQGRVSRGRRIIVEDG